MFTIIYIILCLILIYNVYLATEYFNDNEPYINHDFYEVIVLTIILLMSATIIQGVAYYNIVLKQKVHHQHD